MLRASPYCLSIIVALAACTGPEGGTLDTAYTAVGTTTESTGDSTDTTESTSTETETETGEDTDTGEPDGDPLRYVVAGANEAVLIALDLDDPHDVPEPQHVAAGTGIAALFGPTPFGGQALTFDGAIEQLWLSPEGELSRTPLASQTGNWLANVWFGESLDGANALLTTSVDSVTGPDVLLWARYGQTGQLVGSWDITPPKQPGGSVLILARSPDSRWAAAAVNTEPDGIWDLYLLPTDPEPGVTYFVDTIDLSGVPPMSIGRFLSLQLDDERLVYRREQLIDLFRPVGVDVLAPEDNPVDLGASLEHTYSISSATGDASRLLVTNEGIDGYRELRLIELDGPISAQYPVLLTEPNTLAKENSQPALGAPTWGHGLDALGRVWYAYHDNSQPQLGSVGISLVTVTDGGVTQRVELAIVPPGAEIDDVVFDPQAQLLGYRVQTTNASWINYVDLSADRPASIRVNQNFDHSASEPGDQARYGWSADRSRIAVVGVQAGQTLVHVAEIGDESGTTVAIELPDVELTPGFALDHRPQISPNGDQLVVWFGTQAGLDGLIHAPTDGSASASVVLAPQYALASGTYMPHDPK